MGYVKAKIEVELEVGVSPKVVVESDEEVVEVRTSMGRMVVV